jgi:hypothetical protein
LYDDFNSLNDKNYPGIQGLNIIQGTRFHHVLYAWTINKELRKRFKKERDMELFKEVVCEIENEDFDRFSDEFSNTFLEERAITSKAINDENIIIQKTYYVLSTRNELDYIVENKFAIAQTRLEDFIESDIYIREKYFSDIYRKALHFFKLDAIISYTYPLDDDDIPFNVGSEDILSIYSHLYHNTYRKE